MNDTNPTPEANDAFPMLICADCGMLVANGDDSGMTDERCAEITGALDALADEGFIVALGSSENDHDFSASACDLCRSPLAGYRYEAFGVAR